jgi:hypothetical protein
VSAPGERRLRAERVATLLARLIVDPDFRAAFRRRPAEEARAFGLDHLAGELREHQKALQTLEIRESKSSLAGLLLAAAAEGVAAVEVVRRADDSLGPETAREAKRVLTRSDLPTAAAGRGPAGAPEASPAVPAAGPPPAGMRNTARVLPVVSRREGIDEAAPVDGDGGAGGAGVVGDAYPGDDASQPQLAAWMARAARRAGLPPELPVMAALQESGLRNLRYGDRDSQGFFQMRTSIWDQGEYRGYIDRPELQLRWFIEHAVAQRRSNPGLYQGPDDYGTWIADVERCAAEYRDRYQPHLDHARRLIEAGGGAAGRPAAATAASAPPLVAAEPRPGMMRNTAVAIPTPRGDDAAADGLDAPGGRSPGDRMVAIARRELGVAETAWNDSPRIAHYRSATQGAPGPGAWCAYFVSWVAHEAGKPLGDQGQGFGGVDDVWAWAEAAGRTIPAQGGDGPRPGDLIVWDEHIGLVEKVLPGGSVQTIEGNSSDQVARRVHSMSEPIVGYVRMR